MNGMREADAQILVYGKAADPENNRSYLRDLERSQMLKFAIRLQLDHSSVFPL